MQGWLLYFAGNVVIVPCEVLSLLNSRSVSFLRRLTQYELGKIDDYEIEYAFMKTVEDSGKEIQKF